ncbi:hypothetical protein ACTQ3Y_08800, partial [Segatella copri]|uniref:hypothetical protein n=1 Tax=Segatella copri TaxID=165179 RepID=UPI003F944553
AKEYAFPFVGGITNPPVLIGRTFFTADCKSAGTPSGLVLLESAGTPSGLVLLESAGTPSGLVLLETPYALNQRSPAEGKGKGQKLLAQGIALG